MKIEIKKTEYNTSGNCNFCRKYLTSGNTVYQFWADRRVFGGNYVLVFHTCEDCYIKLKEEIK